MNSSLLSTCKLVCGGAEYTWLALCLSLLSTCSWCVCERIHLMALCTLSSSPPVACVWWAHTLDWLYVLSLLSTCSWCVVSASHLIGSMDSLSSPPVAGVWWAHPLDWLYDSLSSPPVAGVWWAHPLDWLYDSLSSPPCSWCVVERIHLIGLYDSPLLSPTCSWCVVSASNLNWALWLRSPLHL